VTVAVLVANGSGNPRKVNSLAAARYRAASRDRLMKRVINAHSQVLEDRFFDSELIAISVGQKNCEIS
jgi:hypothetical protein